MHTPHAKGRERQALRPQTPLPNLPPPKTTAAPRSWEAVAQRRFKALIEADPRCAAHFTVPDIIPELCSQRVLATEWVAGVAIDRVRDMPQATRDAVGARLLALTLRELFTWRFMQVRCSSAPCAADSLRAASPPQKASEASNPRCAALVSAAAALSPSCSP